MGKLPEFHDSNLLVGFETSDDAAIYKVTDDIAMIHTVDFFTPVVDDPYQFGQIAAANALSDVYAMGGEPKTALNIVGFPSCLDTSVLSEIMAGGASKVREAGAVLVGGHSIQNDEPLYGLCVSGFVHPDRILRNKGARPGDALILTKQLGSGLVNTAAKAEMASEASLQEALTVMTSLNQKAKRVLEKYEVHACTDITGFGLAGHCLEMAAASGVTIDLYMHSLPVMQDALEYAETGLVPAGAYRNRNYTAAQTDTGGVPEKYIDLACDPQTSGGLLVSVSEPDTTDILRDFRKAGLATKARVIGYVSTPKDHLIRFHA